MTCFWWHRGSSQTFGLSVCLRPHAKLFSSAVCCSQVKDYLSACLRRHAKLFSSAVCCSQLKDCLSVCLRPHAKLFSSAVCCSQVKGCLPAMGYSFAAGTTDGPGSFTFRQGMKTENPLWNVVRNFLSPPTECDVTCHAPKPILLATGQVRALYLLFILKVFLGSL